MYTRTGAKPARSYTVIARRLKVATDSENCSGAKQRVPESCAQKGSAVTPSGLFRVKAEPDLEDRTRPRLEREIADQSAGLILDGSVCLPARLRVEELREVILIGCPIVEREWLRVLPERDHFGVFLAHDLEPEGHGR
jgi:hypothetical protein